MCFVRISSYFSIFIFSSSFLRIMSALLLSLLLFYVFSAVSLQISYLETLHNRVRQLLETCWPALPSLIPLVPRVFSMRLNRFAARRLVVDAEGLVAPICLAGN